MTKRKPTKPTKLDTQDLPINPTAQEMKTWDTEEVLRWIKQRDLKIEKDDVDNFKKQRFNGRAFLASDVEFYQSCGLPRGVGLALKDLADEVKEGKFIPWT
jgi:hypothetical protein